jgi:hypothetical protein
MIDTNEMEDDTRPMGRFTPLDPADPVVMGRINVTPTRLGEFDDVKWDIGNATWVRLGALVQEEEWLLTQMPPPQGFISSIDHGDLLGRRAAAAGAGNGFDPVRHALEARLLLAETENLHNSIVLDRRRSL